MGSAWVPTSQTPPGSPCPSLRGRGERPWASGQAPGPPPPQTTAWTAGSIKTALTNVCLEAVLPKQRRAVCQGLQIQNALVSPPGPWRRHREHVPRHQHEPGAFQPQPRGPGHPCPTTTRPHQTPATGPRGWVRARWTPRQVDRALSPAAHGLCRALRRVQVRVFGSTSGGGTSCGSSDTTHPPAALPLRHEWGWGGPSKHGVNPELHQQQSLSKAAGAKGPPRSQPRPVAPTQSPASSPEPHGVHAGHERVPEVSRELSGVLSRADNLPVFVI